MLCCGLYIYQILIIHRKHPNAETNIYLQMTSKNKQTDQKHVKTSMDSVLCSVPSKFVNTQKKYVKTLNYTNCNGQSQVMGVGASYTNTMPGEARCHPSGGCDNM